MQYVHACRLRQDVGGTEKSDQLSTSNETLICSPVQGADGINGSKVSAGTNLGLVNKTAKEVIDKVRNMSRRSTTEERIIPV